MSSPHPREAVALSVALIGLDAHLIHIEVSASKGQAALELIGLSEPHARETRVRVRSALQQIGIELDAFRIVARLAPEDLPKCGAFDVPVALAVLEAIGEVPAGGLKNTVLLGELSLRGALRPIRGVLPRLRGAVVEGLTRAIVPRANAREAASVPGMRALVAEHLNELVRHLREGSPLLGVGDPPWLVPTAAAGGPDLADVRGQHAARRALEVAAAGGHALLIMGPPGSGKNMLARRLPGVLPPLTQEESLEVTAIHSVAGLLSPEVGFVGSRPFRAPHHTVGAVGLAGGGDPMRPGEISLAHHGVLFLDELFELRTSVLETSMRALDAGSITIARARARTTFPARPLVVGAVAPCPCGFAGVSARPCTCSPDRRRAYRARLGGPLLDRFDVRIALAPVNVAELQSSRAGEPSSEVQKRVIAAREIQTERAQQDGTARTNAQLSSRDIERCAMPDAAGSRLLAQAMERLGLLPPVRNRVLRVARTIADLDGSTAVHATHLAEAVHGCLLLHAPSPDSLA